MPLYEVKWVDFKWVWCLKNFTLTMATGGLKSITKSIQICRYVILRQGASKLPKVLEFQIILKMHFVGSFNFDFCQ